MNVYLISVARSCVITNRLQDRDDTSCYYASAVSNRCHRHQGWSYGPCGDASGSKTRCCQCSRSCHHKANLMKNERKLFKKLAQKIKTPRCWPRNNRAVFNYKNRLPLANIYMNQHTHFHTYTNLNVSKHPGEALQNIHCELGCQNNCI